MSLRVERIAASEWQLLRDVRLRALTDSPEAFGSSYEREHSRPHEAWRLWAGRASDGDRDALFIASDGATGVGIGGAYTPDGHDDERHIVSMWVDPRYRRRNLGRRLLDALLSWAWDAGADRVTLSVVENNETAAHLYRSAGFRPSGKTQPLPSNPDLTQIFLELPRPS